MKKEIKETEPIYLRWWFWVIILVFLIGLLSMFIPQQDRCAEEQSRIAELEQQVSALKTQGMKDCKLVNTGIDLINAQEAMLILYGLDYNQAYNHIDCSKWN